MPLTQEQYDADMARLAENKSNAEARAAKFRSEGKEDRAKVWDESADRYARLMEAKTRIFESSQRIQEIRDRISTPTPNFAVATPNFPTPNFSATPNFTATPRTSGGSTTNSGSVTPPPPPPPTPPAPPSPPPPPPPPPVKTAPIDTILFGDETVDERIVIDLLFENIGGQEILSVARYDTVNGQEVEYQPIQNLNIIQQTYNPNNILKLQKTADKIFANFSIKLDDKIPFVGNGPNGENVYLDSNGSIVIDLINIEADEQVEIQIVQGGTIYEVGI